jgi:hypothetical protein
MSARSAVRSPISSIVAALADSVALVSFKRVISSDFVSSWCWRSRYLLRSSSLTVPRFSRASSMTSKGLSVSLGIQSGRSMPLMELAARVSVPYVVTNSDLSVSSWVWTLSTRVVWVELAAHRLDFKVPSPRRPYPSCTHRCA